MNYSEFVTQLANMLPVGTSDAGFVTALPTIITDAEQRLYRELDLLNTVLRDSSAALVSGNRNFTLPTTGGVFLVVDQMNAITPAGQANPDVATRNPLLPASKEFLDAMYPSNVGAGVPRYFAPITQAAYIVGPWPDAAYQLEVVGTYRPAPLSSANPDTLLTRYFADLFFAAAMVFACGYQQNFSAMGDNPASAVSWESHYKSLFDSAAVEEMRKKHAAEGWSSKQPDPVATPART
jgi:hypothetical protein